MPCCKRVFGDALRVEVDGELHVVAGLAPSRTTDSPISMPRLSTCTFFSSGLPRSSDSKVCSTPALSDHVVLLVAVGLVRLVLLGVDLARVPEHVGGERSPSTVHADEAST